MVEPHFPELLISINGVIQEIQMKQHIMNGSTITFILLKAVQELSSKVKVMGESLNTYGPEKIDGIN